MRRTNSEIPEKLNPGINLLSNPEKLLWLHLLVKIKEEEYKVDKITINRSEIETIPYYKDLSDKDFDTQMIAMGKKVASFYARLKEGNTTIILSLFPVYQVSSKGISIEISKYFKLWLSKYNRHQNTINSKQLTKELTNTHTKR